MHKIIQKKLPNQNLILLTTFLLIIVIIGFLIYSGIIFGGRSIVANGKTAMSEHVHDDSHPHEDVHAMPDDSHPHDDSLEHINGNEHSVNGNEHSNDVRYGYLRTFGPMGAPHLHKLDLSQFEKLPNIAKDASKIPSPIERVNETTVKINLLAKEVISEIAPGITYNYWTFNDTVPGPFLRVREGDTVELTLTNDASSTHEHSIDLHAVNGPGGGSALTTVKPGESKTFRFKALNPGLYVYHCAASSEGNVPLHVSHGMYGLILVEPKEGLSKADKEFYLMQGELYTRGNIGETGFQDFDAGKMLSENPDYVIFNGKVNALVDAPLTAKVGDKVRLFVGNGGVSLISSFHVIGEIFDTVFPEAASEERHNVQTTLVPAGGAAIVEFTLDVPGNYVLVDHALARIDKGAWGLLKVEGNENQAVYSEVKSVNST